MIFVFHLYSAEAFAVWGDAKRYIYIWSFLVVLVNWSNLAYAMMSYFFRPTTQSFFVRFTAICRKFCCRSFVLLSNCAVLWFAPSALLCDFLWADLCLLLLISCNACYQGYEKGWGLSSLSQPWWFPVAAFLAYHRRISIWPHLGLSILTSIRQPPIGFHAYICLFSIAFLLLIMISWFHHFYKYELLNNVGLPQFLFPFLHIRFCNVSNWCFPCNRFMFVGFWYIYCSLVLLNLLSASPVYSYWSAIPVPVASAAVYHWIHSFVFCYIGTEARLSVNLLCQIKDCMLEC